MNIKLLIVDDEPIICQGLKMTVPWQEFGIEVVGEAYDGEEALHIIENTDVDIMLTDVNMPGMDGLELAEHVSTRFKHIRMIIISGYDEFEYAKKAIRLGIRDYLLKPVDIDELTKLVKMIREEMIKESEKQFIFSMKQLLSSIVMGQDLEKSIYTNDDEWGGYQLFCSEIKHYVTATKTMSSDEKLKLRNSWENKITDALKSKGIISVSMFINENRLITLCKAIEEGSHLAGLLNSIVKGITNILNVNLTICYTPIILRKNVIIMHYSHLLEGMKCAHFIDEDVYEALLVSKQYTDVLSKFEKKLNLLFTEEKAEIKRFIEELFLHFTKEQWYLEDVIQVLIEFEKRLIKNFPNSLQLKIYIGVNLTIYNSYDSIKDLFVKDMEDYFAYQNSITKSGQHWLVLKAVNYMKEHFANDLKATEVADVINVSPNYFSQLMKQETGKHFNDYLHDIRLDQAKILLKETPYRVFEIAEMVGYKDYKYFVHIFKKSTSITPTQYRNLVTSAI